MTSLFDNAPMLNSVSLSPMDTMGEVRPPARLKTDNSTLLDVP